MSDKMNAAGEERILDLILDKINTLQDTVNGIQKDIKDDRRQLVIDRASCNASHSGRMQTLEDKVHNIDKVIIRYSAYTAGVIGAVVFILKITGIL